MLQLPQHLQLVLSERLVVDLLDEEAADVEVGGREEHMAGAGQTVTSRSANLLVVGLDVFRSWKGNLT